MPSLTVLLGGDLMLGRGIDQCMAQHCSWHLQEPQVGDARHYVALAERCHGPIATPLAPSEPWGEALRLLRALAPATFVVNLETAITCAEQPWPGKAVHYRMHPANVAVLEAAGVQACCLANNHVLDWGWNGLAETLESLRRAGIQAVGAGLNLHQALAPRVLPLANGGRLLLFAWALPSSGVPESWRADLSRPGVALLPGINAGTARSMARTIRKHSRPGDRLMVSLHWGANWVPVVPEQHRWLARQLIDLAGVDLVFGHSSHHPLPLEIHRGKLILYGCGDLINDYEGLAPHPPWRSDLVCLYGVELDAASGHLLSLGIYPFVVRRFQLCAASDADSWLLHRQMGLESLAAGWQCREHNGMGWSLQPQLGVSAQSAGRASGGSGG